MTEITGRVGWRTFVSPLPTIWNNLTHYYSADNTAIDSKGSIHGTLVNGATYSTGKINAGFGLDGVNDYVNVGNLFGFDGTTPFSISFIFKLNANIANYSIKYLVGNQTRTAFPTNGTGAFLYTGDGGATNRLAFAMANNGNRLVVYIKNNLAINTFYHCVVSYNGNGLNSGLNTYINGVSEKLSVFSDSLTLPISSSSQLSTFGSTLGTSDFFNGVIDEVGVWDRALSVTDVTELYNAGAGKQYVPPTPTIVTNGLVLNLDASNALSYPGTGTTWTDLSGNGNNGTLINGTSYSSANGGVMVFDGVNDSVLGNTNTLNNSQSFTTITWFSANQVIAEQHLTNLKATPPTQLYVAGGTIGTWDYGSLSGGTILPNTWYMVVCTRDSSGAGKLYINGQYIATSTLKSYSANTQFVIGTFGGGGYYFGGKIGMSQIYNRDLTLSEIQQNFNATKTRFGL